MVVGGGENDSSVISFVKESRLLTLSELNEGELEWTRSLTTFYIPSRGRGLTKTLLEV